MQISFTADTSLGYDTISHQLRQLADRLEAKPGATAGKPVVAAAAPVANGHANGAAAAPAKTPRQRATKEEMEARRAAEAAAAGAADDGLGGADDGFGDLEPEAPAAPTLTLEQVIDAGKAFALANGREAAGKILARFGTKSVRELKPENFAMAFKAFGG